MVIPTPFSTVCAIRDDHYTYFTELESLPNIAYNKKLEKVLTKPNKVCTSFMLINITLVDYKTIPYKIPPMSWMGCKGLILRGHGADKPHRICDALSGKLMRPKAPGCDLDRCSLTAGDIPLSSPP